MCELFGVSSDHRIRLNDYLQVLGEHSIDHPNGWGYASFEHKDLGGLRRASLIKEPETACDSFLYKALLTSDVVSSCAMAHIRYATVGNVEYSNCHPFSERTARGRVITLEHNGTIFHAPELNRYLTLQTGETDSERILLYLIDRIDRIEQEKGREMTDAERWEFFDSVISALSDKNKLNVLFFDGDCLYAHTNCRDTLFFVRKEGAIFLATSPLSEEKWEPFPLFTLCAYRSSALVYRGRPHGHEYIPNEEDLKYLYLTYAQL